MVRTKLHLVPGMRLVCEIQGDSVVLTPEQPRRLVREYMTDPQTGLRVRKAADKAEPVTTEMIKALPFQRTAQDDGLSSLAPQAGQPGLCVIVGGYAALQ